MNKIGVHALTFIGDIKNQSIEIAFNDNLNNNFVKDLSHKLYEWTKVRWIIAFSKEKGNPSIKQYDKIDKSKNLAAAKKSNIVKEIEELNPDMELIDVEIDRNN